MQFSPEEMALIEAIHADPKNDKHRIAYAFWLEMHDHADYADFIRLDLRYVNEVCNLDIPWDDRYQNWTVPQDAERYTYLESICGPWAEPLPSFAKTAMFDRGVFLVEIPQNITLDAFELAMQSANPRIRCHFVFEYTSPSERLELIRSGRAGIVCLKPDLRNINKDRKAAYSAQAIELMRRVFSSPYVELLESVSISMANSLSDEVKAVWKELAPPKIKTPWHIYPY